MAGCMSSEILVLKKEQKQFQRGRKINVKLPMKSGEMG